MARAGFKSKRTETDVPTKVDRLPGLSDLVEVFKWPDGKWVAGRLVGPVVAVGGHWIQTKKRDGGKGSFYQPCLAWDSETQTKDATKKCPWCNVDSDLVRDDVSYYSNLILRTRQSNKPHKLARPTKEELKTGFKDKNSDTWTPATVARFTANNIRELKRQGSMNTHKGKNDDEARVYPLSHPIFGHDIKVMYDSNEKSPSKKYSIHVGEKNTKLTDEDKEALLWNIEVELPVPSLAEAQKEVERWAERMGINKKKKKNQDEDDDDDNDDDDVGEDEDEDDRPSKKSKKPVKKSKKSSRDDDDDDEDEDDEDDRPTKKNSKKSAHEDDDDDFDDDDEDEDDRPSKKRSKKSSSEDDDDFDDEEDDDEEDERPSKKSKKPAKKSSRNDDDGDDDDEEDDEEDEDDEDEDDRPSKKSKKPVKKPAKKSSRDDDDEDDLGDDEDDEDDDEDDDPPPRKSKKPVKKSKKSSHDDDDDDFDDDD